MQNEVTALDLVMNPFFLFFKWLEVEYQLCSGHRGDERNIQPNACYGLEVWGRGFAVPKSRLVRGSLTLNVLLS